MIFLFCSYSASRTYVLEADPASGWNVAQACRVLWLLYACIFERGISLAPHLRTTATRRATAHLQDLFVVFRCIKRQYRIARDHSTALYASPLLWS